MPGAAPKAPERDRFAALARFAADVAVSAGDAIAVDDIAIVTRKRGRANFATAADHAAERTIIELLRGRDASVPVVAEESARKDVAGAERPDDRLGDPSERGPGELPAEQLLDRDEPVDRDAEQRQRLLVPPGGRDGIASASALNTLISSRACASVKRGRRGRAS